MHKRFQNNAKEKMLVFVGGGEDIRKLIEIVVEQVQVRWSGVCVLGDVFAGLEGQDVCCNVCFVS